MIRFWAIFRITFVQTIRQPIYGILIAITFVSLVLTLPLTGLTVSADYHKTDQQLLANLGLATLLVAGMFLAAFSASSVLSREIEDRTALTVISKPVTRATFVLGKFGGVTGAVAAAFYLCGLVFLMTVRHKVTPAAADPIDWPVIVLGLSALGLVLLVGLLGNYFFTWPFVSTAVWSALIVLSAAAACIAFIGKGWQVVPFGEGINPQLLIGMGLSFLAVLVLVATAVAASTRLGTIATLLICTALLVVGWSYPLLFEAWVSRAPAARVFGWLVPNLRFLDPRDPLTTEKPIPPSYLGLAALYAAGYAAAILALGIAAFQKRELYGQQTSYLPGLVSLLTWAGRVAAVACLIAAVVLLTLKDYHNVGGFVLAAGLLAAAAALWLLWSFFGRGARWSYWTVAVLSGAVLAYSLVAALVPAARPYLLYKQTLGALYAQAALTAALLVLLWLPKTRRHFRPEGR